MHLNVREYSGQTIYAFNKLAELSFEKGKPHNLSLIARIRAILITLKYDTKPEVDIITGIFQIGILLKRSRLFTLTHTDQQLLQEVQSLTRNRKERKRSPSPVETFFNIFKRRNLAMSEISNLSLLLELDSNIKKSKS